MAVRRSSGTASPLHMAAFRSAIFLAPISRKDFTILRIDSL